MTKSLCPSVIYKANKFYHDTFVEDPAFHPSCKNMFAWLKEQESLLCVIPLFSQHLWSLYIYFTFFQFRPPPATITLPFSTINFLCPDYMWISGEKWKVMHIQKEMMMDRDKMFGQKLKQQQQRTYLSMGRTNWGHLEWKSKGRKISVGERGRFISTTHGKVVRRNNWDKIMESLRVMGAEEDGRLSFFLWAEVHSMFC